MTSKPDNLIIRHEGEAVKEASACGYRYRLLSEGDKDVPNVGSFVGLGIGARLGIVDG